MSQGSHDASDRREPVWAALVVALLMFASWARAEEPSHEEPTHEEPSAATRTAGEKARDYWSEARARPFVGGVLDVGSSARGRVMLGWGKPHWTWGGIELEGATTTDTALTAVRARLALVVADVGIAYRKTWAYRRTFVPHDDHLTESAVDGQPHARYRSLDIDVWGLIPAGHGFVQWEVETVRLFGVPKGADVYEEWLRAPVRPPVVTDTRLAYAYSFYDDRATIGAMAEWLWLGGRGMTYRLGPLLGFTFTPHWEINVVLTTPVSSPDDLSFFSGLYGTARVRWRFASGERRSIFR